MIEWILMASAAAAIANGSYENEEDFCNQNGCNYEDIYVPHYYSDDDY